VLALADNASRVGDGCDADNVQPIYELISVAAVSEGTIILLQSGTFCSE
jgi:hypothetical protein